MISPSLGRVSDGLLFVAVESYSRGQDTTGDLYLERAVQMDATHVSALELRRILALDNDILMAKKNDVLKLQKFNELRDAVGASKIRVQQFVRMIF